MKLIMLHLLTISLVISIQAMDVSENNVLVSFAKAMREREVLTNKQKMQDCCTSSADEKDVDLRLEQAEKDCVRLLSGIQNPAITWPDKQKYYSLTTAKLSNKELQTLWQLQGKQIVLLFNTAPSHIDSSKLTKIDLSHNNLHELPLGLISSICPQLKKLNVSHNRILDVSYEGDCNKSLTHVDLSHNQLESFNIGSFLSYHPIESVNLSNNQLKTIECDSYGYLTSYPTIYLQNNQLSQEQKEKVLQKYTMMRQGHIWKNVDMATIIGVAGIGVGTIAPLTMLPQSDIEYQAQGGIIAGSVTGSGILGAGICRGLAYLWYRSELREIAKQSRQHVIFENDLEEI